MGLPPVRGRRVFGRGGGGGKSGGSASNDKNTMRSRADFRLIDAISEGEIEGLVNGAQSIFFDQTPLQNADGTFNFKDVAWSAHRGLADEGYFNGHDAVETPVEVETQVKNALGPTTRTIVDENVDAVRVIMRIPALVKQDSKGGLKKTSVSYTISYRANNGSWVDAIQNDISNQKALSPFQIAHVVNLPAGGSPWDIRVTRNTADSDDDKLQNDTYWEGYVELVYGKFIYPHTAGVALSGNAEEMGSSVPPRSYHIKGMKIAVPSNYDPIARTYSGIWNGSFKIAWTNNPAWIFYDLITNDRYGLGEFVSPEIVDKWSLYTIAQYCDQQVKSGFKNGDTGADLYEPRFTFNGVINTKDEAYNVLQNITQAWRGMAYWAMGQVFATADMPADPVKLVSPANVVGGDFDYAGTAIKARHSVVMVKWNNPDDFYRADTEVVIDSDLLHKYGWRDKTVQLNGCTSRGLAHRYGKWIIDTEQHETDTLTYSASWDHAEVRPGEIVAVSHPRKAQIRASGRVVKHDELTITLDDDFDWNEGQTYQLMLTMPSGQLETKPILAFLDNHTVRVSSAYSAEALADAMWTITGSDITPRLFRVINVEESEPNIFKVTALFHDPQKYARVEQDIYFDPLPYERPPTGSVPPTNLLVKESGYVSNNVQTLQLTVSWTPPTNVLARGFLVSVDTPDDGHIVLGSTDNAYMDMYNTTSGEYTFYVQTISMTGIASAPAQITFDAAGPEGFMRPTVSDLVLVQNPGSTQFTGRDLIVTWKNNFALSADPSSPYYEPSDVQSPHYAFNTVKIYNGNTGELLRQSIVGTNNFDYDFLTNQADNAAKGHPACRVLRVAVTVTDIYGRESAEATVVFSNPPIPEMAIQTSVNGHTIYISYDLPAQPDFQGVDLWIEEASGYNPLTTAPFYEGGNNQITFSGKDATDYFIRVGGFDVFGKDGMLIAPEVQVHTLRLLDIDPPAVPANLQITTGIDIAPDGTVRALLHATVDANTEADFARYEFEIKEGNGNWVSYSTGSPNFDWTVTPGRTYTVRVRGLDSLSNASAFGAEVQIVAAKDSVAPAIPQNVHATGLFRSIWVDCDKVADADLAYYEVEASKNGLATIYQVTAPPFIHSNLVVGDQWSFRIRAVDTSENRSGWSGVATATVGAINPGDLPPDALISTFALIDTAFIESAQIIEIDASKIKAGSVLAGTVKVSTLAGNVNLGDGGALVNNGSTQIDPGKIVISGGTTLADWRSGGDNTLIDGGALSANSVAAESLTIGQRGITVEGIEFSSNSPAVNSASWSAGTIRYTGDDGNIASRNIVAGNAAWTTGVTYLYWTKGGTTIQATTNAVTAFGPNTVVLAAYRGATDLVVDYGRTIIDGSKIKTGTIQADQLSANSVGASQIQALAIQTTHLAASIITADKIGARQITADKIAVGALDATTIKAHSISTDQLVVGGVDFSALAVGACTAAGAARSSDGLNAGLGTTQLQAVGVNAVAGSFCVIEGSAAISQTGVNNGTTVGIAIYLYRNGNLIYSVQDWAPNVNFTTTTDRNGQVVINGTVGGMISFAFMDTGVNAGGNTYQFLVNCTGTPLTFTERNLIATVYKR
jgi:predicted phage tail protein